MPLPPEDHRPAGTATVRTRVQIFTSGFRPDYGRWIRFPAFDAMGFPLTDDGASTVVPGLFFCGVHFLRKRKSSVLFGVGEDAAIVARSVAHARSRHRAAPSSAARYPARG